MDQNKIVGAYSCDLSAAFDMLDKNCLKDRMLARGFPTHLTDVLFDFLSNREAYVTVDDCNSTIKDIKLGCVQGSILGPIIFTIMISPIDQTVDPNITTYADDSLNIVAENDEMILIENLKEVLRKHILWLKKSGFVVNDSKTEIIFFHRTKSIVRTVEFGESKIVSKYSIKFLGVTIDQRLDWSTHASNIIKKCKQTLFGMKHLRKMIDDNKKVRTVMISLFYSKLFYACEIWLNEATMPSVKNSIDALHRAAIRIYLRDWKHALNKTELSNQSPFVCPLAWTRFCLSKLLFKVTLEQEPIEIWLDLLANNYIGTRTPSQPKFFCNNIRKIGLKSIFNQLALISRKIKFDWYDNDLTMVSFAKKAKALFLSSK